MATDLFFRKKVSSFLALSIIIFIAFILGAVIINKSRQLAELQKPIPFYINIR